MQGYTGNLPDEGLDVTFRLDAIQDEAATAEKGSPVFKDVPWVNIKIPGNRDEIIDTIAWLDEDNSNSHIRRFPAAWARFKAKEAADSVSGTPLKSWAGIGRAECETLAYRNIRSIEQLANISDVNLQSLPLPNPIALRQRAKDFLSQANSAESMRGELEALKAQLSALVSAPKLTVIPPAAAVQVLGAPEAVVATSTAPASPARRRGRPPKAATTTSQA